ncbi:hypothetical protein H0H81_006358 [Sphagnurus paluster]|uniref:NACHT domain-containing protein n=1 Tax=Sphagnurus paluster TaxID=117069 RepID=A0A9P7FX80_9AGAR|nr:hypothetical protein H0H81_006358 [Sphagnurus paluster]
MKKILSVIKQPQKLCSGSVLERFDSVQTPLELMSAVKPKRQDQPSVRQVASNTFVFVLSLVEKISECAPVPGLATAVGSFNFALQQYKNSEGNLEDLNELVTDINDLNNILSMFEDTSATGGRSLTDDLGEQLFVLSGELTVIRENIKCIQGHSKLRRIIEAPQDAQTIIQGFRSLQNFVNEILVGAALKAEELSALEHLDKLPRARDARYDYIDRPKCSEGTREGVLKQIMHWVKDANGHPIYWLNGAAGTGKTTIALTVADMLAKDSTIFSASFFCSRESEGRSDARLIFPTFAHHFARCDIQLRNAILRVIKETPDIGHALPAEQLAKLLIGPLQSTCMASPRPIVLILDALDECAGGRAPESILTALAMEIKAVSCLKVFVSSRPTASTNDAFLDDTLRKRREVFVLHDVEKDVVDSDIRDYMMERLAKKAALTAGIAFSWPPEDRIKKLVNMAGGLFIFASTVCEFIEAGDPVFRLNQITDHPTNEYIGIDCLYRQILECAIARFHENQSLFNEEGRCRTIIATILLLQDPLSSSDVGHILGLPPQEIKGLLGNLQSVLSVPEDDRGAIRTLHASFPDFMLTKSRCLPAMYVQPAPHHRMIVMRLLEIMDRGLKRNMAYFVRFKRANKDHFPGYLRYACRYWADHLSRTDVHDAADLMKTLDSFVSTKLVYCLEVLDCIRGPLENLCEIVIDKAEHWLKSTPKPPQSIIKSLRQARALTEVHVPDESLFSLFGLPPRTRYAQQGFGTMCSRGTRNEVLEDILKWANSESAPQLYWLNGAGGTGKTSIAMTIADLIAMDRSKIAAPFFCSRYSGYRRNVHQLFISLSILLAAHNVQFRVQLAKAVALNPNIASALPTDQLRILIVEPLQLTGLHDGKPIVFVIDALDECRPLEEDAPGKIVSAFAEHLHKIPALKVLISTRPSTSLLREMENPSWVLPPMQFNLNDIDTSVVNKDIRRYLFQVLCINASIVERMSPTWPPDELLNKLTTKSDRFFLFASFIRQHFILVGAQKLKEAADQPGSEYEGNLGLNIFFGRMLKQLLVDGGEKKERQFRAILGLLTHMFEPVHVDEFFKIVGIPEKDFNLQLLELQSIVVVSTHTKMIRPLHVSVRHWLTDPERALPVLLVKAADMHQIILGHLIDYMVAGLGPRKRSDVPWYDSMETGLLDYACRHWVEHLMKSSTTPHLMQKLECLLEDKLVYWIQRLHSLGNLAVAPAALETVRIWYHEHLEPRPEIVKAFIDANQMLMERSIQMETLE